MSNEKGTLPAPVVVASVHATGAGLGWRPAPVADRFWGRYDLSTAPDALPLEGQPGPVSAPNLTHPVDLSVWALLVLYTPATSPFLLLLAHISDLIMRPSKYHQETG